MQQEKLSSTQGDEKQRRRSYPRPAAPAEMDPLYLRVPQILRRYGFSRSVFYKLVKEKKLPQPFHPTAGQRMSLWLVSELDAAMERLRQPQ